MTTLHFHLTVQTGLTPSTAWQAIWDILADHLDPTRVELSPPRKILSEDSQAERTSSNGLR